MKNCFYCFVIFIGINSVVSDETEFNEWKKKCIDIIVQIELSANKSQGCDGKLKQNLDALMEEIGKMSFICPRNKYNPKYKFDNANSHFLYSLNEAIGYCKEQNVGQNANLAMVKIFAQQFQADFITIVTEIELLGIVKGGFTARTTEKFQKLIDINEKELDRKIAFINANNLNFAQIKAICGIIKKRFVQIETYLKSFDIENRYDNSLIFNEFISILKRKQNEMNFLNELNDSIDKSKRFISDGKSIGISFIYNRDILNFREQLKQGILSKIGEAEQMTEILEVWNLTNEYEKAKLTKVKFITQILHLKEMEKAKESIEKCF